MTKTIELERGKVYHIYNRGINSENIFKEVENYPYFLKLYSNHIHPIVDTYAYCLLKNHFHLLVRIKEIAEIEKYNEILPIESPKIKIIAPHQSFSNLFNAYTKSINKRYNRTGTLFERPFKRKSIDSNTYLKNVTKYIHYNPVNHGFCSHPIEYAWSSYESFSVEKPTKLSKNNIFDIFEGKENFDNFHAGFEDFDELENLIIFD